MEPEDIWTKVLDGIMKEGWFMIGVGAGEDQPTFCYTLGMSLDPINHPDLIICGLNIEVAGQVLNNMIHLIKDRGARYDEPGTHADIITEPYEIRVVPVDPVWREEMMTMTSTFYRRMGELFPADTEHFQWSAVQALWPDSDGLFPGDEQYSHHYQPRLDVPPEGAAGELVGDEPE